MSKKNVTDSVKRIAGLSSGSMLVLRIKKISQLSLTDSDPPEEVAKSYIGHQTMSTTEGTFKDIQFTLYHGMSIKAKLNKFAGIMLDCEGGDDVVRGIALVYLNNRDDANRLNKILKACNL